MVKQGDIIKINLNPTVGSEQSGYRPAVVITNDFTISKTNIISICPITNSTRKHALNVVLDEHIEIKGSILCAHIKSVDLSTRPYKVVDQISVEKMNEVLEIIFAMYDN